MKKIQYGFLLLILLSACVTAPPAGTSKSEFKEKLTLQDTMKSICEIGETVRSAKGTIWFKIKSKEVTGQFNANVVADLSDQMRLEVVNGLGGTEALMTIDKTHYKMTDAEGKKTEGFGSWNGVPLDWATDLFLGKIPCPDLSSKSELTLVNEDEILVDVPLSEGIPEQKFIYHFTQKEGRTFPESLSWSRITAPSTTVDFKFEDPESETGSPLKWEGSSSEGTIKIRWRKRTLRQNEKTS